MATPAAVRCRREARSDRIRGSASSGRVCMLRSLVVPLTTALLAGGSSSAARRRPTAAATEPAAPVSPSTTDRHADSVYPSVGDPGVDVLDYGLHLRWQPRTRTLVGVARVRLVPARDGRFRLDLSGRLDRVPAGGDRPADRAAGRVDVAARRSAPRRLRARAGRRVDVRRGGGLPRPPRPHAGAVEPRRHGRARLADHAGRPGLDDAGAVRRVHVVPGQRPPVRQGDLPASRSTCRGGGSGCPTAGWTAGASCTAAR